jgi:hypothetical protein
MKNTQPPLIVVPQSPAPEITTDSPRNPAWDTARETAATLRAMGRLYLRGQVKLGMILAGLKKEHGITNGKRPSTLPESGKVTLTWPEIVEQETGYSRQSADVFIRLFEATGAKLKTSKKLALPAPAKKDALAIFRSENPLTLTEEQWHLVDDVIGTLTDGETQASLMRELGILPKPLPMPVKKGDPKKPDERTAGQLAFHFFDGLGSSLINTRMSPDYQKLLHALPLHSTEEQPLSLTTLETEARALLADIERAKADAAKHVRPAKTIR